MSNPNSVKKKYLSSTNQKPPKLNAQPSRTVLYPEGKELKSGSVVSTGSGKETLPSKADLIKFKKRLETPASVAESFYDKFERLERECSENVTRIKSGKDSSKEKKKESSQQKMSTSLLDRKRSKSGSLEGVSQNKSKSNSESFFEMAMKYDTNDLKATRSGHSRNNSNQKGKAVLRAKSRSGRKSTNNDDGTRQRFSASSPSQKRGSSAKYRSASRSERNRSKSRHRSRSSRHDRQESRTDRKRRSRSQSSIFSDKSGRSSATRRGRSRCRKNRSRSRRKSGRQTPSSSTPSSKNSSRRNSLKKNKKGSRSSSVTSKDSSVSKRSNARRGQSNGNENNTGRKLSRTKDRALNSSSAVNSTHRHEIKTKYLKSYYHNSKQNGQQENYNASQGIRGKRTGCGVKGLKFINDLINNSNGKTIKMPSKICCCNTLG
ncbi:hypothetical protein CHS0354_013987 [Potamilus streckersoni]|uniref:Uncharacterized protein n=1 Tax=Potamilus streckersoni TaxID=2493646 RepID=A0AAE0TL70_9BIVA|nr:hypothetical protein CHS0354_013987 [Potamilus streckersoni]